MSDSTRATFAFTIGACHLAVPATNVTTVLEHTTPNPLPRTPDYLLGLIPFGQVALPIINLHRFLGLQRAGEDDSLRRILVITHERLQVGVIVDHARGILSYEDEQVAPPTVLQGGTLKNFLLGEVEANDDIVGLLDVPGLLEAARV